MIDSQLRRRRRPTARAAYRRLRANATINRIGRAITRGVGRVATRLPDWLRLHWPVSGEVEVSAGGTRIRLYAAGDDWLADQLAYGVPWEVGELRAWGALVPGSAVVCDVGANTGVYSLVATARAPGARVFAFEPHPGNAARLRRNLLLNDAANVELVELALGDAEGVLPIHIPADQRISASASADVSFAEAFSPTEYKKHPVPQTTLDAFAAERHLQRIDLIKIDVESYELAVLRGAERALSLYRPIVLCEVVDWDVLARHRPRIRASEHTDQSREIEQLMDRHGYHSYLISEHGLLAVENLRSVPTGMANYLFTPRPVGEHFVLWSELERAAQQAKDIGRTELLEDGGVLPR